MFGITLEGCLAAKLSSVRTTTMTQEEKWMARYQEVIDFIETNHRNPSKHRIEEHDHLNWLNHNRKLYTAGEMKKKRVELFQKLLDLCEQYRRKNQWE